MFIALLVFCLRTALCIVGIFGNALFVLIASFKSHEKARAYTLIVVFIGIVNFVSAVESTFILQRVIPNGRSILFFSSGFGHHFLNADQCFFIYATMLAGHTCYMSLVAVAFGFRYYVLVKPVPRVSSVAGICLSTVILTYVFYIVANSQILIDKDGSPFIQDFREDHPDYSFDGGTLYGMSDVLDPWVLISVLLITLPALPIYIFVLFVNSRINAYLKANASHMSESRRVQHKQIRRCLVMQAFLPCLFSIAVITFAVGEFHLFNHPALEYFTHTGCDLSVCLSPIFMLVYTPQYRRVMVEFFIKNKIRRKSTSLGVYQPPTRKLRLFCCKSRSYSSTTPDAKF